MHVDALYFNSINADHIWLCKYNHTHTLTYYDVAEWIWLKIQVPRLEWNEMGVNNNMKPNDKGFSHICV